MEEEIYYLWIKLVTKNPYEILVIYVYEGINTPDIPSRLLTIVAANDT